MVSRTVKLPFSSEDMMRKARKAFRDEPYDWTAVLKVMTEAMESHPWWKRVKGTPLENDLPVCAAKAFFEMVEGE
jgi:hypothetical protein